MAPARTLVTSSRTASREAGMAGRRRGIRWLAVWSGSAAILASTLLVTPITPVATAFAADPLTIDTSSSVPSSVPNLGIYETTITLSRDYGASDVNDPAKIDVHATF